MINDIVKTKYGKQILAQEHDSIKPMWGTLIHENDLCILFGDCNTGKSVLAHDIAFFVGGKGHEWGRFVSPHTPTMYVDLELTEQQFVQRYKDASAFIPDDFRRTEIDTLGRSAEKVLSSIKIDIIKRQSDPDAPKFIVIDNITNGFGSIYSSAKVLQMIGEFKELKKRFGLTILLIAHCPKRKPFSPITQDSLGGSKMLINFVDSAFAIAPSILGEDIKYIKQIKTRSVKKISDVLSVMLVNEPYLSFKYIGRDSEERHLSSESYEQDIEITQTKKYKW